tara:strand:- start:335 stop:523 length:189 start_codon:yes stop_codon:yes gene_type:complete
MGSWEDIFYEVTAEVQSLGLKKQFDQKLKELRDDDKYKYTEVRDRWQVALTLVKEEHEKNKK